MGKTRLSLELARRFNGEIVSADSRQIYVGLDIGTAKPTPQELESIPHHLINIRAPDEPLALAEYQRLAYATIAAIHRRKRLPLLVGGTALYLRAVVEGLRLPEAPPNPALRAELEAYAATQGPEALHARLRALDPVTAERIDPRNVRRVVRALEIVLTTGKPKSELEGASPPPYRILQLGLHMPRDLLYARVDARVEEMVAAGLVEETRRLLEQGYAPNLPALTSLGYREITAHLRGEMTLDEAIERIKIETHRFVRHQMTWFRRMEGVLWFDWSTPKVEEVVEEVSRFLADCSQGSQPAPP